PQTGKGPSRNAETAKRLTGKALALSSAANILRSQTGVFQQNRRKPDLRCGCAIIGLYCEKPTFARLPRDSSCRTMH
ncbi:hypothetical protein, partial [Rhodovulum sulfidophilum]|uniref:hypothetical protein n=1 Tax=Rhodovulum sulfidophilum TaxID=35806 RepID=UPI001F421385